MKKIFLYLFIAICGGFVSCNKGDDNTSTGLGIGGINTHRVKRMVGKDSRLGNFELLFNYKNNEVASVWRCDGQSLEKRDTLGLYSKVYLETLLTLSTNDYVINIDADSVQKLKDAYPNSYQDTLKLRRVLRKSSSHSIDTKGSNIVKEETVMQYKPITASGTGDSFNNQYLNDCITNYRYEFNESMSKVMVCRYFESRYNQEVGKNGEFTKTTYKTEFTYSGNNVISAQFYKVDVGSEQSWTKLYNYTFTYDKNKLVNVSGPKFELRRSGNKVTEISNDLTTIFTLNDADYVTKIEYNDGTFVDIEYELGHGDYSRFNSTTLNKILGIPYIK